MCQVEGTPSLLLWPGVHKNKDKSAMGSQEGPLPPHMWPTDLWGWADTGGGEKGRGCWAQDT